MNRQTEINKMLNCITSRVKIFETYGRRYRIPLYLILIGLCLATPATNWMIPAILRWREALTVWWYT